MQIVVPDDQLSLAIGRRGQNVRLAAELTGWKIDINSETKVSEERDLALVSFSKIEELSEFQFQTLYNYGIRSLKALANAEESFLSSIPGFEKDFVKELLIKAKKAFEEENKTTETAQQNAKSQAKLLQELESFRDDARIGLNAISILDTAKLQENGYIDLIDIYLEDDIERMAGLIDLSIPEIEKIKKQAEEKLVHLVPSISLTNSN
jgi:transcription termination/antitermination protein NusA